VARDQEASDITRQTFEATHRLELAVRPYLRFPANEGFVRLDFDLVNHGSMTATVTGWKASTSLRRS
jgi:hypothetical protein